MSDKRPQNCMHSMQDWYIDKKTGDMHCGECDEARRLNLYPLPSPLPTTKIQCPHCGQNIVVEINVK